MDMQVKKDFGFVDTDGNSLIKLNINVDTTSKVASWKGTDLVVTATTLLKNTIGDQKAKSNDAADFLVNVLNIPAKSGIGSDRIFEVAKTNEVSMQIKSYQPVIEKTTDSKDYAITGGTVVIFFQKGSAQLGDNFSLDILSQPTQGLVESILPTSISNNNFDTIPGFAVGQPKSGFPVNQDLTQYFKTDDAEGKTVKSIVDLINKGTLKIKVSKAADGTGNFVNNDTIKVKLTIGEITFSVEETLYIR